MSAPGLGENNFDRSANAALTESATTNVENKTNNNSIKALFWGRPVLPFAFPDSTLPGAEHDATIVKMIDDGHTWGEIELVAGNEAYDRYYSLLDPDLAEFWSLEAIDRLNGLVSNVKQIQQHGSNISTDKNNILPLALTDDFPTVVDAIPWETIAKSMDSDGGVCKRIWTTFGDGRPLAEQEQALLREEKAKEQAQIQAEKEEQKRVAAENERIAAEQARIAADQVRIAADQVRIAADQEKARVKAEREERNRMAVEKERARLKAKRERLKRIAAEKRRITLEKERIAAEEEKRRLAKEKAKENRRLEAEKRRFEAEKKILEAEEKKRLEAEEKRLKAEENKKLEAEEKKRLQAEEKKNLEADDKKRLQAEEKKRLHTEESIRVEAEEKKRLEAEKKKKMETDKKRLEAKEQQKIRALMVEMEEKKKDKARSRCLITAQLNDNDNSYHANADDDGEDDEYMPSPPPSSSPPPDDMDLKQHQDHGPAQSDSSTGTPGLHLLASDPITRQERTRRQAQVQRIQDNKRLLEQLGSQRRQADKDREHELLTLLALQKAYKDGYRHLNNGDSMQKHVSDKVNRTNPAWGAKPMHVNRDTITLKDGVEMAPGLASPPGLQKSSYILKRRQDSELVLPMLQAEHAHPHQRKQRSTQKRHSDRDMVGLYHDYGDGLVSQNATGDTQLTIDLTDSNDEEYPPVAMVNRATADEETAKTVSTATSMDMEVETTSTTFTATTTTTKPSAEFFNPHYDVVSWTDEDIAELLSSLEQYGEIWDYISEAVLKGRHSPEECKAIVLGTGFVDSVVLQSL
ncbi:hypothetical protein BGX28_000742 [Mortierella sp. GBA30]|nr:hypothetical protein BGX28_000742 [Mortierella sp. GBA30]